MAGRKRPNQNKGAKKHSFREKVVAMHREIFRRNQQRINESVHGYTKEFQKYEREYARGVRTYKQRANAKQLNRALQDANIVYVGDYHTLRQSQRTFLRLLRRIPKNRPVTLALEFVQGKHQKVLNAFLAGEIEQSEFLQAIDHEAHWLFGGWDGFEEIFDHARSEGQSIIGIDTLGRGPAGTTLRTRDRYAARRIAKARRKDPENLILVLVGELHVAPKHLPAEVDALLPDIDNRSLILYQNCEEIYWSLEAKGLEHEVEIVRLSPNEFCIMNTPPIVCQQSFLNWLQLDDEGLQLEAPEENFKEYARLVASFFDLKLGDALDEVEIATVADLSFLKRLQRRGDFSDEDMRQIREQILRSESYYIPKAKMVYLGNLSVNHAAEEATHFVRHVCSNSEEPRLLVDAFYAVVLEEAVGFLGSKLMNHKRKCPHMADFQRMLRSKSRTAWEKSLARLVLKHHRMETGQRVKKLAEVYECDVDLFNAVTHSLGYQLGDKLYYGLVGGQLAKNEVRELFFDSFAEEGDAFATYLYTSARARHIQIPERM